VREPDHTIGLDRITQQLLGTTSRPAVMPMDAWREGDRFVIETADLGNPTNRWSFNDIGPDSFVYRDEASTDGGKSWRLQSEYQMKRRGAARAQ